MVSTGGTSAGGSGFEYGENTVAARLSIDIPNEGVQSLREITQEISRFRTEMEAASRSQGDFMGFFQTLPSIASQAASAYKTFADELERGLALQQRMQGAIGQWDVQPGSSPDNFRGMTSGMGRSGPENINQTVAEMDRIREMGSVGQRQYLNMQQQRGAIAPGEMPMSNSANDIAAATERISAREMINQERIGGGIADGTGGRMGQQGGIAREIMNEFGAGGSQGGVLTQMLRRGIGAMTGGAAGASLVAGGRGGGGNNGSPHSSAAVPTPDSGSSGAVGADGEGAGAVGSSLGLAGTIGKLLGVPGAGVAGLAGMGLSAFGAAQFLGPRIQNLKDQGLVTGGGAQEGLEQEVQARIMALNPFITNDQSRSIIQSALRDGYKGKEYETVTKFMAENLKDFAISVQDSRDIIKKQMLGEGGLSAEAIAAGFEQQKGLSKQGYLSMPDRINAKNDLIGRMRDMGVPGDIAERAATEGIEMFSDNQILKGSIGEMMAAGQTEDLGMQAMQLSALGIRGSTDFADWGSQLASAGGAAYENAVKKIARQSGGKRGIFRIKINHMFGQNLSQQQANELYNWAMGGKSEQAAAQSRIEKSGGAMEVQDRSAASSMIGTTGAFFSDVLGDNISDIFGGRFDEIPGNFREASFKGSRSNIPILDQLVKSSGGDPNSIMVQGDGGEWEKLQPKNKSQLEALAKGGRWKRSGEEGEGYTLRDAPGVMQANFGKQEVQVGGQVSIHVSTDPGVKVSGNPKTITLTQNQMQANAGWGTATMNNRPPGDR